MKREDEQKLAKELFERRNDEDEWEEEEEEIEIKTPRSTVMSFRLPAEEVDSLYTAAKESEESVSEYIRGALRLRTFHGGSLAANVVQPSMKNTALSASSAAVTLWNRDSLTNYIPPDISPLLLETASRQIASSTRAAMRPLRVIHGSKPPHLDFHVSQ